MAWEGVRAEIGLDHDAGVVRSSRAGTKRSVNAGPTSRGCPGLSGRVPRIQTLRGPFLSNTVVIVAVVIHASVAAACASSAIVQVLSDNFIRAQKDGVRDGQPESLCGLQIDR